jgi:hypothetical protein
MKSIVRAVSPRQLSPFVIDHHLFGYLLVVYRDQTIPALLVVASAFPLSAYEAKTSIVGFPASCAWFYDLVSGHIPDGGMQHHE